MLFKLASITLALSVVSSASAASANSMKLNTGTENKIVPDQKCIDFCTDYFDRCTSSNSFLNPSKSELNSKQNLRKLVQYSEANQPRTNEIITAAVEDCQQTCMTWPRFDPGQYSFLETPGYAANYNSNLGGDTFACREKHLSFAVYGPNDAAFHCPHATNPSTGICRDSPVNGYGPYELLRDGQPSRRRMGYCDLAAHDTIADCTDVGLDDASFGQALSYLPDTVEVIFMNGNPAITELTEDAFMMFSGYTNLQAIYLNDCNIGTIHQNALRGLSNLKVFTVNMNPVAELPGTLFQDSPGLLQFEYFTTGQGANTALAELPANLFSNTKDIERIVLYGHKGLNQLPNGLLDDLTKLNIFSVVDCGLYSDGIPEDLFQDCTSLQFWDFFGNYMDTFDGRWFDGVWEKNLLRVAMWGQCTDPNIPGSGSLTVEGNPFAGMDSLEAAYFHNNGDITIDPDVFEDKENFITLTFTGGPFDVFCNVPGTAP